MLPVKLVSHFEYDMLLELFVTVLANVLWLSGVMSGFANPALHFFETLFCNSLVATFLFFMARVCSLSSDACLCFREEEMSDLFNSDLVMVL